MESLKKETRSNLLSMIIDTKVIKQELLDGVSNCNRFIEECILELKLRQTKTRKERR